jgi:hypothetical protein
VGFFVEKAPKRVRVPTRMLIAGYLREHFLFKEALSESWIANQVAGLSRSSFTPNLRYSPSRQ